MDERLFLTRAAATPPALVAQASYANGLGVIRDLARKGVPVMALDPSPLRARLCLALRRRPCSARPAARRGGFHRLPRGAGAAAAAARRRLPHPRRVRLGRSRATPSAWSPGTSSPSRAGRPCSALDDKDEQLAPPGAPASTRRRTVFVALGRRPRRRAAAALEFPAIFKPVESLAFKQRFRAARPRDRSREELREVYDKRRRLRHADAPGDRARRRRRALHASARTSTRAREPLAVFTGRKLRQHPRAFGTARFAESRWLPELAEAGLRLLRELATTASPRSSSSATRATGASGSWRSTPVTGCGTRWPPPAASTSRYAAYRDAIGVRSRRAARRTGRAGS